ncbi:MAG TPA: pseudouridine synthase [Bacilli bacterium]
MRLDKFISYTLNLTRSAAKILIQKGEVTVNDSVIRKSDFQVDLARDAVYYKGGILEYQQDIYLLLNKPAGYISSRKDEYYPSVLNFLSGYEKYSLFIVGRLDVDSEGLLLLTNDGALAHRLTSPNFHVPKKYYVKVEGMFTDSDVELFQNGMEIRDGDGEIFRTEPAALEIISESEAFITICEGKFHQVKRMCLAAGKKVKRLVRTEIGPLRLDESLKPGDYRSLKPEEIEILKKEFT